MGAAEQPAQPEPGTVPVEHPSLPDSRNRMPRSQLPAWQPPLLPGGPLPGAIWTQPAPRTVPAFMDMPRFLNIWGGLAQIRWPESYGPTEMLGINGDDSPSTLNPNSDMARTLDPSDLENLRRRHMQSGGSGREVGRQTQNQVTVVSGLHPLHCGPLEQMRDVNLTQVRRLDAAKGRAKGQHANNQVNNNENVLTFPRDTRPWPICVDKFERNDWVHAMHCSHSFQVACYDAVVYHRGAQTTCPFCRRSSRPTNAYRWLGPQNQQAASLSMAQQAAGSNGTQSQGPASAQPPTPDGGAGPQQAVPVTRYTEQAYSIGTTLHDGRVGIIVDPGAWTNLCGGQWARQLAAMMKNFSRAPSPTALQEPVQVVGVGQGVQRAYHKAQMPIAIQEANGNKLEQVFEVPIPDGEEGKDVPALLGLRSRKAKKSVLEMTPGKACLTFPGPGGYTATWSPGTAHVPLTNAPSGHFVISCDNYEILQTNRGGLIDNRNSTWFAHDNHDNDQHANAASSDGQARQPPPPPPVSNEAYRNIARGRYPSMLGTSRR